MSWSYPDDSPGVRKWRRRFQYPFLGFLVLAVVDIWLLVVIGGRVGVLPVWLFLIAEAVVGGWLIQRRWRSAWRRLAEAREGKINLQQPGDWIAQLVDTGLVVAGGALLIFPGLITALLGIFCLLPLTRRIPAGIIQRAVDRRIQGIGYGGGHGYSAGLRRDPDQGLVVEGEVVEDAPHGPADDPDGSRTIRGEVGNR